MCTVPLPPGDNPIAVNKYIISKAVRNERQAYDEAKLKIMYVYSVMIMLCENVNRILLCLTYSL
jgi:hypothetical protein